MHSHSLVRVRPAWAVSPEVAELRRSDTTHESTKMEESVKGREGGTHFEMLPQIIHTYKLLRQGNAAVNSHLTPNGCHPTQPFTPFEQAGLYITPPGHFRTLLKHVALSALHMGPHMSVWSHKY